MKSPLCNQMSSEQIVLAKKFLESLNKLPCVCPRCRKKVKPFIGFKSDLVLKQCSKCGTKFQIYDEKLKTVFWNDLMYEK